MTALQDSIDMREAIDLINAKCRELIAKKMEMKENYVAHFLAATGSDITTLELVELQRTTAHGIEIIWWLRPKGSDLVPNDVSVAKGVMT